MARSLLSLPVVLPLICAVLSPAVCPGRSTNAEESQTTYEYYVDSETGKPYSPLYETGPVRYVVQFPGHNPFDAYLYGGDFAAFLSIASDESYAIRNLWCGLRRDGKELIPERISYVSEEEKWKLHAHIMPQSTPARELDMDFTERALIGFIYPPAQLGDLDTASLDVKFDVYIGGSKFHVARRFQLRRTSLSERISDDPRFREREPGEAVLVGPWWLDRRGGNLSAEYEEVVGKAASEPDAAIRLTGRGFLPRLRFGSIHLEGFFLHVDHDR